MKISLTRISLLAAFLLIGTAMAGAQSVTGSLGTVKRGGSAKATVYLDLPTGLHVQSNHAGEGLIKTAVRASSNGGVRIGAVAYPRASLKKFAFQDANAKPLSVFEGRVRFTFPVTVPPGYSGNTVSVKVSVRYQACDEESCRLPATKSITLTANVR